MFPPVLCFTCGRMIGDEYARFQKEVIKALQEEGENVNRAASRVPNSCMFFGHNTKESLQRPSPYMKALQAIGDFSHRPCCVMNHMSTVTYAHRLSRDSAGTATWPEL